MNIILADRSISISHMHRYALSVLSVHFIGWSRFNIYKSSALFRYFVTFNKLWYLVDIAILWKQCYTAVIPTCWLKSCHFATLIRRRLLKYFTKEENGSYVLHNAMAIGYLVMPGSRAPAVTVFLSKNIPVSAPTCLSFIACHRVI